MYKRIPVAFLYTRLCMYIMFRLGLCKKSKKRRYFTYGRVNILL